MFASLRQSLSPDNSVKFITFFCFLSQCLYQHIFCLAAPYAPNKCLTAPPTSSTPKTQLHLLSLLMISFSKTHFDQQKNNISPSKKVHITEQCRSSATAYKFRCLSSHYTCLLSPFSGMSVLQVHLRQHLWLHTSTANKERKGNTPLLKLVNS